MGVVNILNDEVKTLKDDLESLSKDPSVVFVDKLMELNKIERRGNLTTDLKTGEVEMLRPIPFNAKKPSEGPAGEYTDESVARKILYDVVEMWKLFQVNMTVEGHTKGGENDFWQELADNRAALCASTLLEMGVDKAKLSFKGLPGKLGRNVPCVVVKLDIFPDVD